MYSISATFLYDPTWSSTFIEHGPIVVVHSPSNSSSIGYIRETFYQIGLRDIVEDIEIICPIDERSSRSLQKLTSKLFNWKKTRCVPSFDKSF